MRRASGVAREFGTCCDDIQTNVVATPRIRRRAAKNMWEGQRKASIKEWRRGPTAAPATRKRSTAYGTTEEGRFKEQKEIDKRGGVEKLDNKRNELNSEKMKDLEKKFGQSQ